MLFDLSGASGGLAHLLPAGSSIGGPLKAARFHEAFQQFQLPAMLLLLVRADPSGQFSEQMTAQMGHPNPGQDGHIRQEFCV